MFHLKTILHPTDFSADSRYALEVACALARDQSARVVLLHVVPRPPQVGRDSSVPALKEHHAGADLDAYRAEMTNRLQKLREEAPYARVETQVKEGGAAEVIARTALDLACNLIVMGTHGRPAADQEVMGSVASEVMRSAPCPVLTVRVPGTSKAADETA
jgi:nucleotide-binding universal stress UspA family protein